MGSDILRLGDALMGVHFDIRPFDDVGQQAKQDVRCGQVWMGSFVSS